MADRLSRKQADAAAALEKLEQAVADFDGSEIRRESLILRFMLTLDTVWKLARAALMERYGTEREISGAPKQIVREARIAGGLTIRRPRTERQ